MKIDLYAKKTDGTGYVFLNTIDVPDHTTDWKIPVRNTMSAFTSFNVDTAPSAVTSAYREFRAISAPLNRAVAGNPIFLEV